MLKKHISADKLKFRQTLAAVFPYTVPVMTGYIFMGGAFGVLLASKGYGVLWAFVMGAFVYAGSGQFLAVGIMAVGFDPVHALAMTLMINARHFFYGISMLHRFREYGRRKWYMIFSLTDETFALHISAKPPVGVSKQDFYFFISLLDHLYWIFGCVLGSVIGSELAINTAGIDFVMTALFIVIFLEQWKTVRNRVPALVGLVSALLCRVVFGANWLILSCMAVMVVVFFLFKKPLESRLGDDAGDTIE